MRTSLLVFALLLSSSLLSLRLGKWQEDGGRTRGGTDGVDEGELEEDAPAELRLDTGWTLTSKIERYNNSRVVTIENLTLPISAVLEIAKLQYPGVSDPLRDDRETELAWVSETVWEFSRRIPLKSLCTYDVVHFRGIDTVATVWIGDRRVGFVKNAFLPLRYDGIRRELCKSRRPQSSEWRRTKHVKIRIEIFPALLYARVHAAIRLPAVYPHTVNFNAWTEPSHRNLLRKPASDFGWDWGPAFPDARIQSVTLVRVSPKTKCEGLSEDDESRVEVTYEWAPFPQSVIVRVFLRQIRREMLDDDGCKLAVRFGDERTHVDLTGKGFVEFRVSHPRLWYPRSSALTPSPRNEFSSALYPVIIFMTRCNTLGSCAEEKPLPGERAMIERRIGFRHVELVEKKGRFELYVNTMRVMMRGTNLVPADPFPSRVARDEYSPLIEDAIRMNHNTIRVWGGGFFPPPSFYARCDEEGILLWHDLPWACAVFPSDEETLTEAREETSLFLARFSFHPSVVILGGNNEVEASFSWFPETRLAPSAYRRDYVRLFESAVGKHASLVRALEEHRLIYLDSSPSNGHSWFDNNRKVWGNVNDPTRGDVHFYDYDGDCEEEDGGTDGKAQFYYPRALMVSEHGVQSLPMVLGKFVTSKNASEDDEAELFRISKLRMRHENGFQQMRRNAARRGLNIVFPEEANAASRLSYVENAFVTQIIQARCLAKAVEVWRFSRENTGGVLIWQLNDAWPGASWSLVEYGDRGWKLGAYEVRNRFSSVIARLMRGGEDDGLIIAEIEMEAGDWEEKGEVNVVGEIKLTRFDLFTLNTTTIAVEEKKEFDFILDATTLRHQGKVIRRVGDFLVTRDDPRHAGYRLEGIARISVGDRLVNLTIPPYYLLPKGISFATDVVAARDDDDNAYTFDAKRCVVTILPRPHVRLYLWLTYDGVNVFESNGFHLLGGESRTVRWLNKNRVSDCLALDASKLKLTSLNTIVAKLMNVT